MRKHVCLIDFSRAIETLRKPIEKVFFIWLLPKKDQERLSTNQFQFQVKIKVILLQSFQEIKTDILPRFQNVTANFLQPQKN